MNKSAGEDMRHFGAENTSPNSFHALPDGLHMLTGSPTVLFQLMSIAVDITTNRKHSALGQLWHITSKFDASFPESRILADVRSFLKLTNTNAIKRVEVIMLELSSVNHLGVFCSL